MPTEVLSNSIGTVGVGTLAADPGTGGTTLTLTTGHGARFPAVLAGQTMRLAIDNEIVAVSAHTANADTMTIARAQEGTTAAAHSVGSTAAVVLTRASLINSGRVVDPTEYGAVGNGSADDTTALTAAVAALNPGDTLWIGPGKIYTHTTVQNIVAAGVTITGGGEIRATAEATSAVWLTGNFITISNVKLSCPTTTVRGTTANHQKLVLNGCVGARVEKVWISSSAAAGIFSLGGSYYTISECLVQDTRADGYHNVKASHNFVIADCEARNVGDDNFAVVSYSAGGDAGLAHHGRILNCKADGNTAGRLFSCIGGQDVEFVDCTGKGSYAAGIIVATETAVSTHDVARVLVQNCDIRGANTVGAGMPDHGGLLIDAGLSGSAITDVIIRDCTFRDTRAAASYATRLTGVAGATVSGVVIDGLKLRGTQPTVKWFTNRAASEFKRLDITNFETSPGWELIGSAVLAAAAVSTGAITIPTFDQLMIVVRVPGMSAGDIPALRFNADTANNYWTRFITSVAGGVTMVNNASATTSMLRLSGVSSAAVRTSTVFVGNYASWQKACQINTATSTGAAGTTAPLDVSGAGEWVNAAAQITSVELRTASGTNTLNQGSGIMIYGKSYT